jgi:hypothetical protein
MENRVKPTMRMGREHINRLAATNLLENMATNRSVSVARVRVLANAMAEGEWDENEGSPIRIGDTGQLIDGQHRLQAVVTSDTEWDFIVLRDVPMDTMPVIDTGKTRSLTDVLTMQGEHHCTTISSAIHYLHGYSKTGIVRVSGWNSTIPMMSILQGLQYLKDHPGIREAAAIGSVIRKHLRGGGGRWAALYYLLSTISKEDADYFIERVLKGDELGEYSPIIQLRKRLIADMTATRKLTSIEYTAIIFKAWNAFRRGEEIRQLYWRAGGANPEGYPEPI